MPISVKTSTRWYETPKEGTAALRDIIADLNQAGVTSVYIETFIFTHNDLLKTLLGLIQKKVPVAVLHDLSQWSTEDKGSLKSQSIRWAPLIQAGADVTLTTSMTPDKYLPGGYDYNHRKAICIVRGKIAVSYVGSVNFTHNGFQQTGDIIRTSSSEWGNAFIQSFKELRKFARNNLKTYQLE